MSRTNRTEGTDAYTELRQRIKWSRCNEAGGRGTAARQTDQPLSKEVDTV